MIQTKYNTAVSLYTILLTTGARSAQSNPTLAAGDVTISKDGGAFTNMATLPDVLPLSGVQVRIQLSATETSCKVGTIKFKDQSGAEWDEQYLQFFTYGNASAFTPFDFSQTTPNVNATQINSVSTSAVTAVNANIGQTQPLNFTGTGATAYVKTDVVDIAGAAVSTSTAQIGANVVSITANAITSGAIADNAIDAGAIATGAITSAKFAAGAIDAAAIADNAIDAGAIATGAITSAKFAAGAIDAAAIADGAIDDATFTSATYPKALRTSTAVSGTAGTITLDAGASTVADFYTGDSIKIASGTGAGQSRTIILYTTGRVAYVDRAWATNPDNTSVFVINTGKLTLDIINVGVATSGSLGTITIASAASSVNDFYDGSIIQIIGGTGVGQSRVITSYIGATKVATVWDVWATTPDSTSIYVIRGMGDVEANIISINSNSAAAVNLSSQFDGTTGLTGNTFPARQDQLSSLVAVGAAVNKVMASWTNLSTPVATTETGGVSATQSRDATYDVLTNASQAQDSYYETNIGSTGVPVSVAIYAAVQNGTKSVTYYAYDWVSSSYKVIGTQAGTNGFTLVQNSFALTDTMVGTGANLGKVRIRILSAASATTVSIDQMYVSYSIVNQSVGYSQGAVWVDTVSGTAGTTSFVNGTADHPVLTWADALTIASALGLKKFNVAAGSTITLSAATANYQLGGEEWTLILNGQNVNQTFIHGADVSGIGTAVDGCIFDNCDFDGNTTLPLGEYRYCGFQTYTFTLAAGNTTFTDCYYEDPSASTWPIFTFVSNAIAAFRQWRGAIQVNSMGATNYCTIAGSGRVNVHSSSTGGQLTVRGFFGAITGASAFTTAGGTITQVARYATDQTMPANLTQVDAVTLSAHASGMVPADMRDILGTAVSSPATAGILDINVKNMNNVAATSITAINANQGTTQPINFTGTAASALVKSDTIDIASAAVSSASAQIGVNVVSQNNIDFGALQKSSLNAATPASVTGSVGSVAGNVSGSVASVTGNVAGSVASVTGRVTANTDQINGVAAAADRLSVSAPTMVKGTVIDTPFTPTTTQFEASDITTAAADFYLGRTVIFTSGALANQARTITAYSLQGSNGRFTVVALSSAPANGVTFIIV